MMHKRYAFPAEGEPLEQIRRLAIPNRERELLRVIASGGTEQTRAAVATALAVNPGTVSRLAGRLQDRGLLVVEHRRLSPSLWLIDWAAVAAAEGATQAPAVPLTVRADRWSELLAAVTSLVGLLTTLAHSARGEVSAPKRRSRRQAAISALRAPIASAERASNDDDGYDEAAEIAEAAVVQAKVLAKQAEPKRAPQRTEGAPIAPEAHASRESGLNTNQDGMGFVSSLPEKQSNSPIPSHPDTDVKNAPNDKRARTPELTRWTERPIERVDLIDPKAVAGLWQDALAVGHVRGDQLQTFVRFCRAVFRLSNRERPPQYPIRDGVAYFLRAIGTGRTSNKETARHWASKIEQVDHRDGDLLWAEVKAVLWPNTVERPQPIPVPSEPPRAAYRPQSAEQWAAKWRKSMPLLRAQLMQTTLNLGLIDETTLAEVRRLLELEGTV